MKEIIIIETNKPQKLKNFLDKEHFAYKVYQEPKADYGEAIKDKKQDKEQLKKQLIAAYQRQAKNKKLQSELALWDSISGDGL